MAKDKKGKTEGKKAKIAEKKQKQEKKKGLKNEKTRKKQKEYDSDSAAEDDEIDLEAVLASYAKEQEQFLKVTEIVSCDPPKPRSSASLIASPANSNELFLFGGEYFNGVLATFFNDLYVYLINKDEWRLITSPNTPLPRSGHAWCRGGNQKSIFLFGGEFSSPKQGTFYHFWQLDPSTREWTRLEVKGKSPSARSGHRMTYYKNYIILFGGFQDNSQNTKYLADLWIYDTQTYSWFTPDLPSSMQKPDARSSFSFLPHEKGAVLFGGYSRVKVAVAGKPNKGHGQSHRNVYKPVVHQDCYFLRMTQSDTSEASVASLTVRWERRKNPTNTPKPARAGVTMTYHKCRGILFGGVHDVEESEEGIDSEFFNGLFAWNIERNRFFPLTLRKPRPKVSKLSHEEGKSGRRGRGQANEEDLLKNLALLEAKSSLSENQNEEVRKEETKVETLPEKETTLELPHIRFNAQLTVQDDCLYIYGGTFEKGNREFTFDDMYAIDLGKLDGVKHIFHRETENWQGSDIELSEEEEDDEGTDIESREDESREEFTETSNTDGLKPNKSRIVAKEEGLLMEDENERQKQEDSHVINATRVTDDDNVDDDLPENTVSKSSDNPYPRPFESRRDFFQRTSNEWQEFLMTSLRWKGILPESLTVKEIKTKAFELSENYWWECREEIMMLEDEQEAAGIGEIVTLAKRETYGGIFKKR
ncbi:Kelch repeat-containing protein 3 [Erysiphe neolycopersici]|uniref:Kelch repeat-containing protein 3 n=1 Tax=Erysiphe neolycopersici TaxID=212602 RepID=A0A420HWX6_9PEZI|nr:Kelch repeat-containing protein 3 [Erysiphe neolycopersici]